MATEQEIEAQAAKLTADAQALADMIDQHVELALGVGPVVYLKFLHPATCPERQAQTPQLPPANPEDLGAPKTDVPDAFKRLWDDEAKS